MSAQKSKSNLNEWEDKFAKGQVTSSREHTPNLWLSGNVYVVKDLADQLDPISTGSVPFYKVIAHLTPSYVVESEPDTKPHLDRLFAPGDVHVISKELSEQDTYMRWQRNHQTSCGIISLMIEPAQIKSAARDLNLDFASIEFMPCAAQSDPALYGLARALGAELELGDMANRIYAEQMMQSVAIHLVAKYSKTKPILRRYRDELPAHRMRRIEAYVRSHLNQSLSLTDLAKQAALSDYYFAHQFKATTGESPAVFVRRLRMENAAQALRKHPHKTIAAIAAEVGYADPASFAKAFRRHFGTSPSQYRQANQ